MSLQVHLAALFSRHLDQRKSVHEWGGHEKWCWEVFWNLHCSAKDACGSQAEHGVSRGCKDTLCARSDQAIASEMLLHCFKERLCDLMSFYLCTLA